MRSSAMMADKHSFLLTFYPRPRQALDQYALAARQDHNLGNRGRWFHEFRGGLYGMYAREAGIARRYHELHAWTGIPRNPTETNTIVGELFFNADSALECLVYALNAFGFGAGGRGFRDTASEAQLKKVRPTDPVSGKVAGWVDVFPSFTETLAGSWAETVQPVMDQHDVAKHRRFILRGGRTRSDPPDGYWEVLGIADQLDPMRLFLTPYSEILLRPEPKRPQSAAQGTAYGDAIRLEELIPRFADLLNALIEAALTDVRASVELKTG